MSLIVQRLRLMFAMRELQIEYVRQLCGTLGGYTSHAMVCCVVLNWNGWQDTLACLASLAAQTAPLRVAVVDNASTDDSEARLDQWIAQQRASHGLAKFTLLPSGRNGGFAFGNNVGIRWALEDASTEFVWLLNNDTVAPPDTLAKLLQAATHQPRAGFVGSVLRYAHDPARVQAWGGGRILPEIGFTTHFTKAADVGPAGWNDPHTYFTFASVLIRREALKAAGLLDEHFFMYYEDADLNLRMRQAGWGLALAEDTAILHKEGGSRERRHTAWSDAATTSSALYFIGKHARWPLTGRAAFLLLRSGKRLACGRFSAVRAVWRAALKRPVNG